MTGLLELTVYFIIWTLISVVLGAAIRNQEWTKEGRDIGLGNRDDLKEATPMGGARREGCKKFYRGGCVLRAARINGERGGFR